MILHYEFDDVSIDYEVDRDEVIPKLKKWIIENLTKEDLLDKVRLALSKHIVKDLAENNELKVIEFSDETLDRIYSFFKEDEDEAIVRIEADQVQEIVDKIAKFAKAKKITNPTLVVPMDIRHMVFVILAEFVRNITVLAHEELVSDYNIKFVGKV